jgi:hypothetical protein
MTAFYLLIRADRVSAPTRFVVCPDYVFRIRGACGDMSSSRKKLVVSR